ncbi:MAG: chromate transporter [Epulopiscium sp. Nele67-Bin004]|nr:MAG: chromate transporter [Epulopiscium sp. Nele67-Bin004]
MINSIYLILYLEFCKIGAFSVGGGLATIPFLQELVEQYGWITQQELIDIVAIAESTPGAIGVNAATFMGYKVAGIWGGIISVLGLVSPAIVIIVIVARIFDKFRKNKTVQDAFYGIRPAAAGIIAAAAINVGFVAFGFGGDDIAFQILRIAVCGIIYWLIQKYNKHPIFFIIIGGILGIILPL